MMTLVNEYQKQEKITKADYETLIKLLNPIAPHLCEELWNKLGHEELIVFEKYPDFDPNKLFEDVIPLVISINGKVRDKIKIKRDMDKTELEKIVLSQDKIKALTKDKTIIKVIVVPNKLVNIVIK